MSSSQNRESLQGSKFDSEVTDFPLDDQNGLESDLQQPLLESELKKQGPPEAKKVQPPQKATPSPTGKKVSPRQERKQRQVNGRIQKLSQKSHPLDKTSCFGAFLFTWAKPFIWIGSKTPFEQRYHPPAPLRDKVDRNEARISELYKEKGSIGRCVIALYRGFILKNFFLMALCQFCLCSVSLLMYKIIIEATDNHDADDRTQKFMIYLGALCVLQIFGSFLKNYIQCDLSRLSVRLKCGVIYAIYKKLLKISILNPNEHTESNVLNYMNVDAQKLEDAITKVNLLLEAIWLIIYGFSLCIWLISYNIVACIITFFGLTFITMSLYKVIFKYEVMVAIAKDKRTQLLKNIINNVKYIKTRVWENFYHSKIFQAREAELSAIDKSNFIFVVIVVLAWFNPTISYLSTFASMLVFNYAFTPAIILAYVRIFSTILKGMGYIPVVVQFFIELKVSLDRINTYLDTDELDFSWINSPAEGKEPQEEKSLGARQPFAIELDLGNFYWNKMDEKLMKERREKSRRKKVAIRKMKFDGTTSNDAGLFAAGNDNQSMRTVSVQNSVMTKSTMQSSIVSKSNPTLTQSLMSGASNEKLGFQIMDIDMLIPKGELVMIVGEIGSGKSSLFQAIMNEMNLKFQNPRPALKINGEMFYVSQNPWLLNMSIKDNVILDKPFDQKKFDFAIKYSALDSDLKLFDDGAMRMIADGASNLSGGQRTRVTLARALYQDPDIYLFDDPLSALDGNVGEYLMQETIQKQLSGKTRIIITHAMHFLKYADTVYYVENGRIVFKGTYEKIKKEEFFQHYLTEKEAKQAKEEEKKKETQPVSVKVEAPKPVDEVRKIETKVQENPLLRMFASEDKDAGGLGLGVLHTFIMNTGGYACFLIYIILSAAGAYYKIIGVRYIFDWASNYEREEYHKWTKMGIFTAILFGYCSLAGIRTSMYMKLGIRLSRRMHSSMIFRVLHAPVEEFIEVVSGGRILNRFTKDVNVVDRQMMKAAIMGIFRILEILVTFYFMAMTTSPLIVGILLLYFFLSLQVQSTAMKTKREVLRLEAISKSPIVSWATATIKGLGLIRTSKKENWFTNKMMRLVEDNLKNSILIYGLDSWYQLRVSLMNIFLVQVPCYALLIWNFKDETTLTTRDIEDLALFMILATALTEDIIGTLQSLTEFQGSLISIERCKYFNDIPYETGYKTVKSEEKKYLIVPKDVEPKSLCLPHSYKLIPEGKVEFRNVTARYGEDSEPVLKNLTFTVQPGEKVGIVGRTGAGKSSLIKLFWMSLKPSEGQVLIDGNDATKVDLKALRNEVMIVSQESALFMGQLRENIDPVCGKESDEEMRSILDKLSFRNKLLAENGLDAKVDADGSNYSQGERQVICFARTMLNKRKLIVLDEATANVDLKTEQAIQKAQESEFKDSTMFIIAHRINTVMNCDKIMVLKFGELMEFDSPANLLKNPDSYFKNIYDKMVEQNEGM